MDYQKYMDGGYQGYMDYENYYHKYMNKYGNYSDHSNHMVYQRYMKFANCMREATKQIQNSNEIPERDNTSMPETESESEDMKSRQMAAYTKCKKIMDPVKAALTEAAPTEAASAPGSGVVLSWQPVLMVAAFSAVVGTSLAFVVQSRRRMVHADLTTGFLDSKVPCASV